MAVRGVASLNGGEGRVLYPGQGRKIVFAGDSETANGVGGINGTNSAYLTTYGYMNQFLGRIGSGYNYIVGKNGATNLPIGANVGIGGNTSTQLLARYVTDVISKNPDIVSIEIGTNDIKGGDGTTFATLTGNISKMIAANQAIGAETWLHTVWPRNNVDGGGGVDFTANERLIRASVNSWIRAQSTVRGVTVIDHDRRLCNAAGDMITGYTYDGLHLNATGAYYVSDGMIESLYGQTPPPLLGINADAYNVYDATYNVYGSILTNGVMAGTSGTAGTGVSGNVATGWTIKRATGSDVTAVASKITRTFSNNTTMAGQRLVITTTGAGTSDDIIRCRSNSDSAAITTMVANGLWCGGSHLTRISPAAQTPNLLAAYMQIADQSANGNSVRTTAKSGHGGDVDIERTVFFNTPPLLLLGNTGVFVDFFIEVDATIANTFTLDLFACDAGQLVNAATYT